MEKKASKNSGKKASKLKGYDNVFAQRLRELMEEKRITQETLATKAGCSRQSISQYMDGTSVPNVDKLLSIAEYFGVSTDYFLGLSDTPTNDKDLQFVCDYLGLTDKAVEMLKHTIHGDLVDEYGIIRGADNKRRINYLFESQYLLALCSYMNNFEKSSSLLLSIYSKEEMDKLFTEDIEKYRNAIKESKEIAKDIKLSLFEASRETESILKYYAKWERETNGND